MTLHKKDLIMLAGDTIKWAAENNCVKMGEDGHDYFSVDEWTTYFDHSPPTFGRVKIEMIEMGICIAQRPMKGHYISDEPQEAASSLVLHLKNIKTRLETLNALADSAGKSKNAMEILDQVREVLDDIGGKIDLNGGLVLETSSINLLPKSVE